MPQDKFIVESHLVSLLMLRLGNTMADYANPNLLPGQETGVDVVVVVDGRRIGIQVTELDAGTKAGVMRGLEVFESQKAKKEGNETYGFWAQNDPVALVAAVTRTIKRKVEIAAKHDFADLAEVWLLVVCGVPLVVGTVSTMVMTPWVDAADLAAATQSALGRTKYHRVYLHSILGAEEQALYAWEPASGWSKDVLQADPRTWGPSMFDVLSETRNG